ncbi:ABC transporter ATP-binding protein [Maritalea porphyrae]|uniref:ABC transporter ATP-binding protein n=1 Tax=Maritalea porphyrae TaxID=880732 RepID=UPI0022AEB527|nr:ABC transporter ATP-binding protein [Maritalea porphyrae]MCZ4273629.1 ABC transporter ATP-binding protein [Maritalea porphyrae]
MLKRFFSYYLPHKRLFFLDFGCAIASGVLELLFPLAIMLFVDQLLPSGDWPLIATVAAVLLGVYVLNTCLIAIVSYWGHKLGINIETDMRNEAFDHLQKLSFRFFDHAKLGKLITHVTKDLDDIGEVAHHGPEDVFIALMTFAGALAIMFFISWEMALITGAVTPLITWLLAKYGRSMTANYRSLFAQIGEINTRIAESVGGTRLVKAFANEEHEQSQFRNTSAEYRTIKLQAYNYMTRSWAISYFAIRFMQLVVMVAGSYFVTTGQLTSGEFVGFLIIVGIFVRPIEKLNAMLDLYPRGIAGFRRFLELMDTQPDIVDAPDAIDVDHLKGDINYNNVSFSYGKDARVFTGLDLSIKHGETVALVGPSGAGKSTICALLPRFYEVDSGEITIDGTDIQQFTQSSLRQQIGVVAQEVFLFAGTIKENIAYGRLGAGDEEIRIAIQKASLANFVDSLSKGWDTLVGERGIRLSGGQKQRLSIARIFLKNPPILILDEATSALDTATEKQIQSALAELSKGRTTLVVAHRLATIRKADRIIVVTEKGVVEQGSHDELLAHDGVYAGLHNAQVG